MIKKLSFISILFLSGCATSISDEEFSVYINEMNQMCLTLESEVNEQIISPENKETPTSLEKAYLEEVFYSPKDNTCLAKYYKYFTTYNDSGLSEMKSQLKQSLIVNVFTGALYSSFTTGYLGENGVLIEDKDTQSIYEKEISSLKNSNFIKGESIELSYDFFIKKIEDFKLKNKEIRNQKILQQEKIDTNQTACLNLRPEIIKLIADKEIEKNEYWRSLPSKEQLRLTELFYSPSLKECIFVMTSTIQENGKDSFMSKSAFPAASTASNDEALEWCSIRYNEDSHTPKKSSSCNYFDDYINELKA